MRKGELRSPSLLRTNVSSGRMAFESQRERLLMDAASDDDLVSRLDEHRLDARMRTVASLS
jgi:hypothetical protein